MEAFGNSDVIFWCNSTVDKNESYDKLREIIRNLLNRYLSENGAEKIEEHTGSSETAEITVRERRPYKAIWNRIINIGPAEDLLNLEMQKHIMLLKDALLRKGSCGTAQGSSDVGQVRKDGIREDRTEVAADSAPGMTEIVRCLSSRRIRSC